MPSSQRPLVFLQHPTEEAGYQTGHSRCPCQDCSTLCRVPLVGHRRGAPARLRGFGNFVLHQKRDVARDFTQRRRIQAARADERAQTIAVGVPGRAVLQAQGGAHGGGHRCRVATGGSARA